MTVVTPPPTAPGVTVPDPAHALTPTGNLARRIAISRLMQGGAMLAAALAVTVLAILVGFTVVHGVRALSWHYLTGNLPASTGEAGGIGPAILGTAELALMAGAISVFFGIIVALFLSEFSSARVAAPVRLVLDLMAGLPAIVVGVFMYGIYVAHFGQAALAASLGLSIIMTPMVARATLESLQRVPSSWREAAQALGVSHWRAVMTLILPGAASGITTGAILAVAWGAGETAPLLFTDSLYGNGVQLNPLHAVPNLPTEIFTLIETGYPVSVQMAWGAAFLLMIVILLVNIGARMWLRRGERKRGL